MALQNKPQTNNPFKIHFNIILPSAPNLSRYLSFYGLRQKLCMHLPSRSSYVLNVIILKFKKLHVKYSPPFFSLEPNFLLRTLFSNALSPYCITLHFIHYFCNADTSICVQSATTYRRPVIYFTLRRICYSIVI
jgi:hypothetical protein